MHTEISKFRPQPPPGWWRSARGLVLALTAFTFVVLMTAPSLADPPKIMTGWGTGGGAHSYGQAHGARQWQRGPRQHFGFGVRGPRHHALWPQHRRHAMQRDHAFPPRAAHNCRKARKRGRDRHGRPALIVGTICHDAHNRRFIVNGSRHIVRRYR